MGTLLSALSPWAPASGLLPQLSHLCFIQYVHSVVTQASHFLVPLTLENDLPDPLKGPDHGSSIPFPVCTCAPLPNARPHGFFYLFRAALCK